MEELLTIQQIRDILQQVSLDIPQYIKTGIPDNIKSDNIRSLETRSNEAALQILDVLEVLSGSKHVIVGSENPNTSPPPKYAVGQLYLQRIPDGLKKNIALFIYTGIDGLGWWQFLNFKNSTFTYGVEADPNVGIPGSYNIGDFYIRTSTGDSSGNITSVWQYVNLHSGVSWINITASSSYPAGTLELLNDGDNTADRVWKASILNTFISNLFKTKRYSLPAAVQLSNQFELEFLDPDSSARAVAAILTDAFNWDITWRSDEGVGNTTLKSLKQEYAFEGAGEPLTLYVIHSTPSKPDSIYIRGYLSSDITIPAGAIFTIW